ncbi:MAG: hydrogenase 4 subunit B [Alphaproteobacteria bacterium]|nr:hydrogenase 4 subunit B [Alphaproteobacteria bacterium]
MSGVDQWTLIGVAQATFVGLAVAGCLTNRRRVLVTPLYALAALASLVMLIAALGALFASDAVVVSKRLLPVGLPDIKSHLRLDGLAAVFLVIVNIAAIAAALYGVGYDAHTPEPARVLAPFPLFLAGMNIVPLADDAFTFLVGWEFMSLASWLMVLAGHDREENRRAALVYLTMAAFGALALLMAFGALAGAGGGYSFDAMRAMTPSPGIATLAALALLLGAGSKAGLAPLHVWLPLAHPAAPSHVSALMSGAMTKVAIYALMRGLLELAGPPQWWWGGLLAVIGALTAALGALQSLTQTDTKTVLAFSTIENIGVIAAALGLAIAFRASGQPLEAGLALVAALFHALNHGLFKSLLFFGAGAVLHSTGTRELDRLGGLIHRLRWTAPLVLVGCIAISAVPPLNGFASEWLVFQSILDATSLQHWELKFTTPLIGALVALAAALAAASFVRFFGIAFLGRPRDAAAAQAHEVSPAMLAAMAGLAALCLAFGAWPGVPLEPLARVAAAAADPSGATTLLFVGGGDGHTAWLAVAPRGNLTAAYSGMMAALGLAALTGIAVGLASLVSGARARRGPAWDCGFPDPNPATQYTASSVGQPLRRIFGSVVLAARDRVDMPPAGDQQPATLTSTIRDPAWHFLFDPLIAAINRATERVNALQFLAIRVYLSLMFAALIGLLIIVAVAR